MIGRIGIRTISRGAGFFIGHAYDVMNSKPAEQVLSAFVERGMRMSGMLKLMADTPQRLDTAEERRELERILRLARDLAIAAVRDARYSSLGLDGNPVEDLEELLTQFREDTTAAEKPMEQVA